MKCVEVCIGKIDLDNEVPVSMGFQKFSPAFACRKCGRLHFIDGDEVHKTPRGVLGKGEKKAYWIDGKVVRRQA